ncbi:MAG TPA: M20 family metallopeptidase [Streptosporangiaceae bacterium]|jgi:acetylornithine deacetylase/succinyl-diaminopimelate desuccinylase-like protein
MTDGPDGRGRSSVIDLTAALVAAPSPNPPGGEGAAAEVVAAALRERGLPAPVTIARATDRPNLLVTLDFGPGGRHLCLSGHLDTKPVGDAVWSVDPMRATIDGDRLYGLGSADMKGAVAAMAEAAAALAAGGPPRGRLTLLFTADEEDGAAYGARHLAEGALAEAGLPPIDAVVIGEPGGIDADWDRLHRVSRGIARLRVTAGGDQGHSSLAERTGAVNASVEMARLLAAFADGFRPSVPGHDPIEGWAATVNAGLRVGGGVGYGVIPGEAYFDAEVRLLPGMDRDGFDAELHAFLAAQMKANPRLRATAGYDAPPCDWLPGTEVPAGHPVVAAVRTACERVLGAAPPDSVFPGTTDAAWLHGRAGLPTLPAVGPGLLKRCHGRDEWVSVAAVEQAVDVYRELAAVFCAGEVTP